MTSVRKIEQPVRADVPASGGRLVEDEWKMPAVSVRGRCALCRSKNTRFIERVDEGVLGSWELWGCRACKEVYREKAQ